MKPSYLLTSISQKIILFIAFILFLQAAVLSAEEYSNKTLIIKFKQGTELLRQARIYTPKNISESLIAGSINMNRSSELNLFMNQCNIYSIKAVKPDAELTPLAGGMERIFIVEINNAVRTIEKTREYISQNTQIEYAEFDYIGYAGGNFAGYNSTKSKSVIPNTGQTINGFTGTPGGDINAVNAWDVSTGTNVIVSILDSGMPLSHPEFAGRLLQGYDYANNDNNPTDDQGHGSNVGSIVGAKGNNGSLMAGVNWNCRIIPVKILDANNSGFYSWFVSGITYAVDNGAKVLNMSVGGSSYSQPLADAVTYAFNNGRIVVACMMNNNNNITYYPAGLSNVISIGAINNRMQRAVPFCWGGGSSYGPHIDFAAPGEMILGLVYNNQNTTSYWCGTSQATPMVTGIISLLIGANSSLTFTQVYDALKNSARDQVGPANEDTPGFDNYFGWGLVDSRGALNQVIGIEPISTIVPDKFGLKQNYPNPFNPVTKIQFDITKSGESSKLRVFNSVGQQITVLVNEVLTAGTYEVEFNAANYASGIYYYKLESGKFSDMKKMVIVK
jgi:hypothetical protein